MKINKPWTHVATIFPKKCHLGPQNGSGSSGLEKLLKTVNCATIKETEKLIETMVGFQVDIGGHLPSPPGPPPLSFSAFSVSLIVAQLTIFSSFFGS